MAEKWVVCTRHKGHDGLHAGGRGGSAASDCGVEFREIREQGSGWQGWKTRQIEKPQIIGDGGYSPGGIISGGSRGILVRDEFGMVHSIRETGDESQGFSLTPGVGAPGINERIGIQYNPEPPYTSWAGPMTYPDPTKREPPRLVPDLDPNASLRDQALQAQAVLAEMGVTPEQAMAIIMVTIATSDDVREEASKYLALFTKQVMEIVNEWEEGPDGA